jgi:hypothetical protein
LLSFLKVDKDTAEKLAIAIFKFTSLLMTRSLNKQLYNSLEHGSNFLGAVNDELADAALECISAAVCPSR